MYKLMLIISIMAIVAACGGGEKDAIKIIDESESFPGSSMVRSATMQPGNECEAGGVILYSGIDVNENGVLDSSEIKSTKVVCHGIAGYDSLIKISDEFIGSNCVTGGKSIAAGKDLNRNNILDESEISDTQYMQW